MGITIDSFTGGTLFCLWSEVKECAPPRQPANVATSVALWIGLTPRGRSAIQLHPFAPEKQNAREHPPRLSHRQGAMCLRRDLGDPLHPRRSAPRHLQQLPPVLHREAEAARHAGPHRPLQAQVRQFPGAPREAEEASSAQGRREEARQGKEAQGREEDRQGTRRQGLTKTRGGSRGETRVAPLVEAPQAPDLERPSRGTAAHKPKGRPVNRSGPSLSGSRGGSSGTRKIAGRSIRKRGGISFREATASAGGPFSGVLLTSRGRPRD